MLIPFHVEQLTLQKPTFVLILAKYILLCDVSAKGPASTIITYDLPLPPTENTRPSYLKYNYYNIRTQISQKWHLSINFSADVFY